ncbi:MAG TPA: hypothetical protein VI365_10630, partial [Trebonia sp.]
VICSESRGRHPPRERSQVKIQPSFPEVAPGFMQHLAARAGCGQDERRKDHDEKRDLVPLGRRSHFIATRRTPCRQAATADLDPSGPASGT